MRVKMLLTNLSDKIREENLEYFKGLTVVPTYGKIVNNYQDSQYVVIKSNNPNVNSYMNAGDVIIKTDDREFTAVYQCGKNLWSDDGCWEYRFKLI